MRIIELAPSLGPATAFLALAERPYPYFLDSTADFHGQGRRSYVASDPFLAVHAKGRSARLSWLRQGREEAWTGNPFELLRMLLKEFPAKDPGPFPLAPGGAVGYLAYDLFPHVEPIARRVLDDLAMPDLFFGFYDSVAAFDHQEDKAYLAQADWGGGGPADPDGIRSLVRSQPVPRHVPAAPRAKTSLLASNFTPERYRDAVRRIKEYIAAGDIYQANLSQRFSIPYEGDPLSFYLALRRASPAPFGAALFPDGCAVLSNSPERYLRIEGEHIETRPIKGTRPRGRDREEDERLARELRESVKDQAEHVMIVDLERNDLGRVAAYGSVRVPELFRIESYANVHHLVSTVAGSVHPLKDTVDCISNSFPGGSITGAPKVRALEVIEELEPTARGVYCGSIGYIDFSGRVDLSIAIRTAILKDGLLRFQAGGGIVADSDPEEEYEETLTKAQSFLKVVTGEGRLWQG